MHLDLAQSDDSWMVYVIRRSQGRVRVFRKTSKFPTADFAIVQEQISADLENELLELARKNGRVEQQSVG